MNTTTIITFQHCHRYLKKCNLPQQNMDEDTDISSIIDTSGCTSLSEYSDDSYQKEVPEPYQPRRLASDSPSESLPGPKIDSLQDSQLFHHETDFSGFHLSIGELSRPAYDKELNIDRYGSEPEPTPQDESETIPNLRSSFKSSESYTTSRSFHPTLIQTQIPDMIFTASFKVTETSACHDKETGGDGRYEPQEYWPRHNPPVDDAFNGYHQCFAIETTYSWAIDTLADTVTGQKGRTGDLSIDFKVLLVGTWRAVDGRLVLSSASCTYESIWYAPQKKMTGDYVHICGLANFAGQIGTQ